MDIWREVSVPSKDGENVGGRVAVFYLWKQFVRSILETSHWGSEALGSLCQGLPTITERNFFLMSNLNLPVSRLKSLLDLITLSSWRVSH